MKLNWAEKWVVNNPIRIIEQKFELKWFQKALPIKPGGTILEIGCGRGAGARLILKNFRPSLLLAQDLDLEMIQKAGRYLSLSEKETVSLSASDATRIPLKNQSVDAVFGFGFLHHVLEWQNALREIARVMKPGASYYIEELYPSLYQNFITKRIVIHPEQNRFNSLELSTAMAAANLPIRNSIELKKIGILAVAVKSG